MLCRVVEGGAAELQQQLERVGGPAEDSATEHVTRLGLLVALALGSGIRKLCCTAPRPNIYRCDPNLLRWEVLKSVLGVSLYIYRIAMASRIQLDLQRIDVALKSCPTRTMLKSDTMESWTAINLDVTNLLSVYRSSIFSDHISAHGGAATWLHWRKSNASRQLLIFVRAVMEVMEAEPGTAGRTQELLIARPLIGSTLNCCIALIANLLTATQSAALWPAMREWIMDQGGIKSVWAALARTMMAAGRERAAVAAMSGTDAQLSRMHEALYYSTLRTAFVSALTLTNALPTATSPSRPGNLTLLPGLVASLSFLFSDVLPRDLVAGNAHEWHLSDMLRQITMLRNRSRSVWWASSWCHHSLGS